MAAVVEVSVHQVAAEAVLVVQNRDAVMIINGMWRCATCQEQQVVDHLPLTIRAAEAAALEAAVAATTVVMTMNVLLHTAIVVPMT